MGSWMGSKVVEHTLKKVKFLKDTNLNWQPAVYQQQMALALAKGICTIQLIGMIEIANWLACSL